jgi:hypothetical protein
MKTIYQIFPKNRKCLKWIKENVYSELWQWLGRSLCIERRYIQEIYNGLIESGFKDRKDFDIN